MAGTAETMRHSDAHCRRKSFSRPLSSAMNPARSVNLVWAALLVCHVVVTTSESDLRRGKGSPTPAPAQGDANANSGKGNGASGTNAFGKPTPSPPSSAPSSVNPWLRHDACCPSYPAQPVCIVKGRERLATTGIRNYVRGTTLYVADVVWPPYFERTTAALTTTSTTTNSSGYQLSLIHI